MNIVRNAIICISCKQKLKAPVFLPCGHSICKHHIEDDDKEERENNKRRKIECDHCNEAHEIPMKGFAPNRALESLMKVDIDKLDLGEEYNSAFNKCAQFEDLLEQFNKAKNDPETRIHSVLSDLRNKVDLKREELKEEIDKKALDIIEKINEFEKDCCKASINSDSSLDKKIGEWENEVKQSQLALKILERNTVKWNGISNKMKSHLKDLQFEFIKLNKSLFLNRLNEFIYSDLKLTNNDFHVFSMEVNKLSRYRDIKEEAIIAEHSFKAFGIEWILMVNVDFDFEDINQKDQFITIILDYNCRTTKIHTVKVDFDLEILDQLSMNKSIIKHLNETFDSIEFEGCGSSFITLNGLLDNYNLYNVEKDSFTVQVVIKNVTKKIKSL